MSEVIDATAEEVGTEVVPAPAAPPSNLFRTDDPAEVLERATATANALAPVLRKQGMLASISGKDHVRIEGWTTLGSMLGVTAVGVWTRKLDNGWEAKVNAQTLDGRVIGSAEAMCVREESRWKSADDYAIRSMAQTRAASKALASVLRFVVTLAGFEGTPAEEMPSGGSAPRKASEKQLGYFRSLVSKGLSGENKVRVEAMASSMTAEQVSKGIEAFKDEDGDTIAELVAAAERWAGAQTDVPYEPVEQPTDDGDTPF